MPLKRRSNRQVPGHDNTSRRPIHGYGIANPGQHQREPLEPEVDPALRRNLIVGFLLLTVLVVSAFIVGLSVFIFPAHTTSTPEVKGSRPTPGPTATYSPEPDSAAYGHTVPTETVRIIAPGTPITYTYYPPASGPHYASGAPHLGFFSDSLDEGYWLNNLEHGAVVILYQPDLPPDVKNNLKDLINTFPPTPQNQLPLLIIPYTKTPRDIVILAWGREEEFNANTLDNDELLRFYRRYAGRGPLDLAAPSTP